MTYTVPQIPNELISPPDDAVMMIHQPDQGQAQKITRESLLQDQKMQTVVAAEPPMPSMRFVGQRWEDTTTGLTAVWNGSVWVCDALVVR